MPTPPTVTFGPIQSGYVPVITEIDEPLRCSTNCQVFQQDSACCFLSTWHVLSLLKRHLRKLYFTRPVAPTPRSEPTWTIQFARKCSSQSTCKNYNFDGLTAKYEQLVCSDHHAGLQQGLWHRSTLYSAPQDGLHEYTRRRLLARRLLLWQHSLYKVPRFHVRTTQPA